MATLKFKKLHLILLVLSLTTSMSMVAQIGGWKADLIKDSNAALVKMINKAPKLQSFKDKSYGYAVFPKITKGAIGIGGAAGKGIVYEGNTPVGESSLKQATIGFQLGGQQYMEVIFFENKTAFEKFTNKKVKFSGQASAVAIKPGVSIDVAFKDGLAVFTKTKGGLV